MVSALPPASIDAFLERLQPEAITTHTIVNKDRLRLELTRTRAQGYAIVDQELELGLRTIAVPVRDFRGDTVAAINISVHAARIAIEDIVESCLPALLKVQVELAALL